MDDNRILGDRYRLDERVDGGGMGDVWRGRDIRLDRTVAIKVLHAGLSGDQAFRQRFHGEARAVAALNAPGVVNLYDYGEDTTRDTGVVSYLVMEFVPGRSLRTVLGERGSLGVTETLDVVAQSAEALDAAHRAGIIHRDIKPGNILIDADTGQVKIVDFGIARTRGQSSLTETGVVMGSVCYVAPEQLYGEDPSGASDVYSLGVVAYEALAGRKPFDSEVPATIINDQLTKEPPPLPEDVPAPVREVIARALAKTPADRWESAAALASACRELLAAPNAADATVRVAADAIPTLAIAKPEPRPATPAPEPAAEPVSGGTRGDGAVISHRRPGILRPRTLVVATALLAVLTAGGIAAARGWDDTPVRPDEGRGSSSADGEPGHPSGDITIPTGQPTSDQSSTAPSSSESSSTSSSPSPTDTSQQPDTAAVPTLTGLSEDAAYAKARAKGFTDVSSYPVGSGEFACEVVEQNPGPGTKQELDEPVTFGVQYGDTENCEPDSSAQPEP